MKIAKKIGLTISILLGFLISPLALSAYACTDNSGGSCGGPSGNPSGGGGATTQELTSSLKTNPIVKNIINPVVNFLSAGVGIVVVGTLIIGGIQYSIAGDSAEGVSKAKKRITNGLIALLAYLLIFGFLQWVIPGGIFNS